MKVSLSFIPCLLICLLVRSLQVSLTDGQYIMPPSINWQFFTDIRVSSARLHYILEEPYANGAPVFLQQLRILSSNFRYTGPNAGSLQIGRLEFDACQSRRMGAMRMMIVKTISIESFCVR